MAIYVPRSLATDLRAWVNGNPVSDEHWNHSSRWNAPALFVTSPVLWRTEQLNEVALGLYTRGGPVRLSTLEIGPADGPIRSRYELRLFATETVPRMVTVLLLTFGTFVFAFWWRRRDELAYLLCSATMLAWSVYLVPYHLLPSADSRWSMPLLTVGGAVLPWVIVGTYAFIMRHLNIPRRAAIRLLMAYAAMSSVATLCANFLDAELAASIWALTVIVAPVPISMFILLAELPLVRRFRTREFFVIVASLWVQVGFALHDSLQGLGLVSIGTIPLVPFSASLTMCAFAYALLNRYIGSLVAVEASRGEIERQLAERSRELELSHARLLAVEREQALAVERQRLMREMHDGMGSSLMSSLLLVEQGRLDSHAVAQVLRESIDDLKLTIDSLEPIGHDLPTLLGTLRYRLGSRLEHAGLKLEWRVGDVPPLDWLDAGASLQVLRILQEALTNVVKHAGADAVRIETDFSDSEVVVRVVDNGHGIDAHHAESSGRGLQNMRSRAEALSAHVALSALEVGSELVLRLPRCPPPRSS